MKKDQKLQLEDYNKLATNQKQVASYRDTKVFLNYDDDKYLVVETLPKDGVLPKGHAATVLSVVNNIAEATGLAARHDQLKG